MTTKFNFRFFIILLLFVSFFGLSCKDSIPKENIQPKSIVYQDLLDSITDSSSLMLELKDLYRAYQITHFLSEQKDFGAIDSIPLFIAAMQNKIVECEQIAKKYKFHDDSLGMLIYEYILATKNQFKLAKELKGFDSPKFDKQNETFFYPKRDKFYQYLKNKYSNGRFLNLSEDEYWKQIDKKQYIKSTDFDSYTKLKNINPLKAEEKAINIIRNTKDFQEKSIYGIDLADFYIMSDETADSMQPAKLASIHYQLIMESGKYSLYLFETWLKWRTVVQYEQYGSSKFSAIPNELYNEYRDKLALTVLKQVSKDPTNEMTINQFLLLATHENIARFGSYNYGNQNVPVYFGLFRDDGK